MRTLRLFIGALDRTVFDGEAVSCTVSTPNGRIGFEARHEPFIAVLKENSEIRYTDAAGAEAALQVRSGFLSFRNNACSIAVE